jgi:YjbR
MNAEELRDYCLSLLGTDEDFPFGPDTSVFKVAGKIFALSRLSEHPLRVCQWPSVSPHWRPSFLPTDGHFFSPLVATNLPTHTGTSSSVQLSGLTPFPAVA